MGGHRHDAFIWKSKRESRKKESTGHFQFPAAQNRPLTDQGEASATQSAGENTPHLDKILTNTVQLL